MTIKKIDAIFRDFVAQHGQLKTYNLSEFYKIDTTTREYPLMWATPVPSSFNQNQNLIDFEIMFADLLDTEERNLIDGWSDTREYALDFVRYFNTLYGYYSEEYDLRLNDNIYLEPFKNLLDSNTIGWFLKVQFVVPANTDYCSNPQK